MSHNKTLEELLVSTRNLPTGLSFDEVEFLFLHPTPPPSDQRGRLLKIIVVITLLFSLLTLLLPTPMDAVVPELTSFPVREYAPTLTAVASLARPAEITSLSVTEPPLPVLATNPALPIPDFVPAAAPKKPTERTAKNGVAVPEADGESPSRTGLPPILFAGSYDFTKKSLFLTFTDVKYGPTYAAIVELSAEESRAHKKAPFPQTITRAAGSLLLYKNGKADTFEFVPNEAYRKELNKKGWGDAEANNPSIMTITTNKRSLLKEINFTGKAINEKDYLWLNYFNFSVNDRYIQLLRDAGYSPTDLRSLWKLPNTSLSVADVEVLAPLLPAVFTDLPGLDKLSYLEHKVSDLQKMDRQEDRTTYPEFRSRYASSVFGLSAAKNDLSFDDQGTTADDQYWSLEAYGTVSDTISGFSGKTNFKMKGNFKIRITKDADRDYAVAYGIERTIRAMKRRSRSSATSLVNPHKRQTIYLEVPQKASWELKRKGVSMQVKTNPKE